MKNENRTKNILRNICISLVVLFIGVIAIVKSIKVEKEVEKTLYNYNINENAIYTVKYYENEFFESQTLEMNRTYISSLVENINMNYIYSFSGNKKSNMKYEYQIVAVSTIRYQSVDHQDEPILWSKQYTLVEPKEFEIDKSNYVINENFTIDFATYNNEVTNFKRTLKLPIKADLQIKLVVKTQADVSEVENIVVENSIMSMSMDLNEDVFIIEKQFENANTKAITEKTEAKKEINKVPLILGSIFVIVGVMIVLDSIRKFIKFSQKTDYAIALNRILKNYGDIVAEIVSPIEIDNLNIIEVKNFDQLLDIEEEVRMPILFYETIPGEQGEFVIVCDNMAYRYVIGK